MKAKATMSRAPSSAAARQRLYIEEMLRNGGNKRAAALAAGCKSDIAADRYAARLSQNVAVQQELTRRTEEALAKAQEETGISVARTLRELACIAHLDPADLFDANGNMLEIKEMPEAARRALASIEVVEEFAGKGADREHVGYLKKIKFADKNSALDKAMKHLGLFREDNLQKPPTLPPQILVVGVRPK